ncbi:hypothetical protein [Loigolactobacillus backii]|uniref:hypothetical protein n=1 Tax=Loigolactobacillus backii TaxID=375175 RepID=UPI0007F148BD|nr:hypothetical protein [Loigolactobacillus backii]ANK59798.1 hypothetical protein AYR52_05710 [Loigolactobacillus backii]ANK60013.1 hypothetical protein AYR52_06895 [Loigolactobacillus backii]
MFNKKSILSSAWMVARRGQVRFGGSVVAYLSESLKIAWFAAKHQNDFRFNGFKTWFTPNDLTGDEFNLVCGGYVDVKKVAETAKAVKLDFISYLGWDLKVWAPKAALATKADLQAKDNRKQNAFAKMDALKAWAKDHGVKGLRKFMKKTTVIRKINDLGLVAPAELI